MKRVHSLRRVIILLLTACILCTTTACNGAMGEVEQKNDRLVLWSSVASFFYLPQLAENFKNANPGIEVQVEDYMGLSLEQFNQKLLTESTSGGGPDIIFTDYTYLETFSVEKMMNNGAFADMSAYFTDFNWDDYNQTVMDAGVLDGKRYLFPLDYAIPVVVAPQSVLEETGFKPENCTDYTSFFEECGKYLESHPEPDTRRLFYSSNTFDRAFCGVGNLKWADYKEGRANLSIPGLKEAVEAYKPVFANDQVESTGETHMAFHEGNTGDLQLFYSGPIGADNMAMWINYLTSDIGHLNTQGGGIFFPVRNHSGGVTAHIGTSVGVRNNSANKELAAKFIKYQLSYDNQVSYMGSGVSGWPVLNEAAKARIDTAKGENSPYNYMGTQTPIPGISDGEASAIFALTGEIDSTYFGSPYDKEFFNAFVPYWRGESSYEDCAAAFQKKADILISE